MLYRFSCHVDGNESSQPRALGQQPEHEQEESCEDVQAPVTKPGTLGKKGQVERLIMPRSV